MILLLYKQNLYNFNVLKVDSISKPLGNLAKYLYTIQALSKLNKGSNKIIIRTMMCTRNFTPIIKLTPYTISVRNHPDLYRPFKWSSTLSADEKRRLNLTQHETTHYNIEDVERHRIVMLATSSQGKHNPNGPFPKISPEKIEGSCTPLINKTTKEPLMDDYGYLIPNTNKGGQYAAILQTSRKIEKDIVHKLEQIPELQAYLDKHEARLKQILNEVAITNKLSRTIGGQDDE